MSESTAEALVHELADAKAENTLSLRMVLRGFISQVGGPEAFGRELGKIMQDEEVAINSRVALGTNIAKLLDLHGEGDDDEELLTREQILTRYKQLEDSLNG